MRSQKQRVPFKALNLLLQILMAQLLLASCAKPIQVPESVYDAEWCHPFKDLHGLDIGASCDDFLTSNPELLSQDQWRQKQVGWLSQGGVTECTPSTTMINLKVFIEQTCSQVTCDEKTVNALTSALQKVAALGAR